MTYYSSAAACSPCPDCSEDNSGSDGEGNGYGGGCYINNINSGPNFSHTNNQETTIEFDQLRNVCNINFSVDNVCHTGEIVLTNPDTPQNQSRNCIPDIVTNDCSDTVGWQSLDQPEEPGQTIPDICHVIQYRETRSASANIPFKLCRTREWQQTNALGCMTPANSTQPNGQPKPVNLFRFKTDRFKQGDVGYDSCLTLPEKANERTYIYPPFRAPLSDLNGSTVNNCCNDAQNQGYNGIPDSPPYCTNATLDFEWDFFGGLYLAPFGTTNSQSSTIPLVEEPFGTSPSIWRRYVKAFFAVNVLFAANVQPDPVSVFDGDSRVPIHFHVKHTVYIVFIGKCEPTSEVSQATKWVFTPAYAWVDRPDNAQEIGFPGPSNPSGTDSFRYKGPTLAEAGVTCDPFEVLIDWPRNPDLANDI